MLRLRNIHKYYQNGETTAHVLDGVSLTVDRGEFCIIYGPSGSGKTTLLNIMGTLENCDSGDVFYDGHRIQQLNKSELLAVRQEYVGYIFQSYNLFQTLTARENIMMGGYLADNLAETDNIIEAVGLTGHHGKYPYQLSGGQQQRVAIARAIAKKPKILFCDEPTGALDSDTSYQILNLLQQLQRHGLTVIMVTHDPQIKEIATKLVYLHNGRISAVEKNENAQSIYSLRKS